FGTSLLQRSITDTTLVVRIEITGIKKSFVGWWSGTRTPFRAGVLFPDARGGSSHGPPGYGHLRGVWDRADRTGLCAANSSTKCWFHSIGGTVLRRSWRSRQER